MRAYRNQSRRFGFESLEHRTLLAGNVTAAVAAGTLALNGDGSGNAIQVWQSGANWKVQGLGTTVNGSFSVQTFAGVTNIVAALEGGNDFIRVFDGVLPGALVVSDSGGNDVAQLSNITAASITVNVGDGRDTVALNNTHTPGSLVVATSATNADGND